MIDRARTQPKKIDANKDSLDVDAFFYANPARH